MGDMACDGVFGPVGFMDLVDMAQAARNGRDVNGRVAATDDDDPFAHVAKPAVVESLEKRGCRHAVGRIGSVHRQRTPGLGTQTQKNRVIVGTYLRHADVGADPAVHPRLDAQVQNALNLGVEDVSGGTEAWNAIAHHSTQFGAFVKDGDVVTFECQLVGSRQTGGSAANNRHLFSTLRFGLSVCQFVLDGVLSQEVFDGIDSDEIFHLIAVAAGLARGRADAPHDRWKRICFGQSAKRVFLPVHAARRFFDSPHDVQT